MSTRWLREQLRVERRHGGGAGGLGVDPRVAELLGLSRMPVFDLSDGHFHHIGYDDPRAT